MSGDCFIKFDQVEGETADKDFSGAIDVLGWNWGVSWAGNRALAAKSNIRAAEVKAFEFSHRTDAASSGLMHRCYTNALIKEAVLSMRRAGGKAQTYLKIRFKKVQITSVSLVHDEANEIPIERVSIAFEEVEFDYTPQAREGGDTGRKSFAWNLNRE